MGSPDQPPTPPPAPEPSGPKRIEPTRMVVSGPSGRRVRRGGAGTSPEPGPASSVAPDAPVDRGVGAKRRSRGGRPSASPPTPVAANVIVAGGSAPDPARPPVREGRQRRILLDASLILAGIAVVLTAGSFLAAPPPEEGLPSGSDGPTGSGPAVSAGSSGAASPSPTVDASETPPTTPDDPPGPSEATLSLVEACPDIPDCFVYPTRPGDTLGSVGILFGVTRTGILALNAGLAPEAALATGTALRIPPPTR